MYSNRAYFNDVLKARKSMQGFYSQWDATSGVGTSGNITLSWSNIQSLSPSYILDNFMMNLRFRIKFTVPNTASNKHIKFNKDINNACSTLVTLSGGISKETPGIICNIFKNYSERYKSVPDLDKQDLFYYNKISSNIDSDIGGITYTTTPNNQDVEFYVSTSVPIYHEFLLQPIGGITSLTIRIIFANNLLSLIECDDATNISNFTATCEKASITYTNYKSEITDGTFDLIIPHFETFAVNVPAGGQTVSQTRSTESCPNSVFQFIAQNPLTLSSVSSTLQKPLPITSTVVTVNGNSNAFNTTDLLEIYGRCKAYNICPYLGELSDWADQTGTRNEFSSVVKYSMSYLDCNQNTHETFRFASTTTCTPGTYTQLYQYTFYLYASILHLSPNESYNRFATELLGDVEEFENMEEQLLVGGGFWDKFKSFGKKVIQYAPGLINKAGEIANVVAPGSKTAKGFEKASQISNILTGTSTSLF